MQSLFPNNFKVKKIYPIDWYDGIVTGIVDIQDFKEKYFVSLLVWDQKNGEKIFLMLPVSDKRFNCFLQLLSSGGKCDLDKNWKNIMGQLSLFRSESKSKGWIIKCNQFGERVTEGSEIDIDKMDLRHQVGQSVELALNNEKAKLIIRALSGLK